MMICRKFILPLAIDLVNAFLGERGWLPCGRSPLPPGPTRRTEMLQDEIRRAVLAAPRGRLAETGAAMWKAWAAGAINDEAAGELSALIEARKVVTSERQNAITLERRRVGSRPRLPANVERRRRWAGGGWLPPEIAARFTPGEIAALSVVAAEVAMHGRCELPLGAVAGRAGVCLTVAKRAVREARRLGLLNVVERRISACRNLPNVITLTSSSWASWVRFRARKLGQGGGGTFVPPQESSSCSSTPSSATSAAPSRVFRCEQGGWRGISSKTPRAAPARLAERVRAVHRHFVSSRP